jgi:hypothetical protein
VSLGSDFFTVNTSFGPVYNATFAFNVTAGTGKFDGSFVAPTMKAYNGNVTLWTLATASTFLKTSQYSTSIDPINCAEENSKCESYLLPGGVRSILPNPPVSNLDPIVLVHDSPASQVEFAIDLKGRDQFSSEECIVYGDKKYLVGVEFCLAHNSALPGSIVAGEYR